MKLQSADAAYQYLIKRMRLDVEEFWAVALAADKKVLKAECIFRGTVDCCLFHPRDIFRFSCQHNAVGLLVAHNHPSGNPKPSREDHLITRQLMLASDLLQIPIVDHVIVAKHCYFSYLEARMLPNVSWQEVIARNGVVD